MEGTQHRALRCTKMEGIEHIQHRALRCTKMEGTQHRASIDSHTLSAYSSPLSLSPHTLPIDSHATHSTAHVSCPHTSSLIPYASFLEVSNKYINRAC